MNWLLTILFFICIFAYFYLLGDFIVEYFELTNRHSYKTVFGFLSFYLINLFIITPCKLLKVSWNTFALSMTVVHGIILFLCIFRMYKNKRIMINNVFNTQNIINHIKSNWYIYFLVVCFIILYRMNVITYYTIGYDDRYYISKMVHSIGSPALDNENYFTGALLKKGGIDFTRLLNSFELVYAYLASIFHIYVPFFAKISMNVLHYLISFLVYKMLADKFVHTKRSQFSLMCLSIFMIPLGLLNFIDNPFKIEMYDLWQITAAMFYGGALVRFISLPLYLISFNYLYESFSLRKVILIGLISLSLISFSTIMIVPLCMVGLAYVFLVCKDFIINRFKDNFDPLVLRIIVWTVLLLVLLLLNTGIRYVSLRHVYKYRQIVSDYEYWYKLTIAATITFTILPIELFVISIIEKKKRGKITPIISFLTVIYLIIYFCKYNSIVLLTSFDINFVARRFISSLQILSILFLGMIVLMLLEQYCKKIIISSLAVIIALSCIIFPYMLRSKTTALSVSSVSTAYNYEFGIAMNNDYMVPDVIHDVGDYFNSKVDGHYKLMFPVEFNWDFHKIKGDYFLMSSRNIVLAFPDDSVYDLTSKHYGDVNKQHFILFNKFLNNSVNYEDIKPLIKKYKIQYIFVTNEYVAKTLLKNNYKVVLQSNKKHKSYKLFEVNI